LLQKLVDNRGFAVIDVSDNCDVTELGGRGSGHKTAWGSEKAANGNNQLIIDNG
jgi:hypothetical protein